jgi:hypothetical protein
MASQLYLVICGTREPYVAERDLKDMGRAETIKDLAAGEWGDVKTGYRYRVSQIIEIGTGIDVTAEFEAAAHMPTIKTLKRVETPAGVQFQDAAE